MTIAIYSSFHFILINLFPFFSVAYAQKDLCTGPLEIKSESGYLSSRVAKDNGCGTLDSPWFVTVSPGQRIRFSLLDFGGKEGVQHRDTGKVRGRWERERERGLKE